MSDASPYKTNSSWLISIYEALESESVDASLIFEQSNFPLSITKRQDLRIDTEDLKILWKNSVAATKNDAFGLIVTKYLQSNTLNALGVAFEASANVREVIDRALKYYQIISNAVTLSADRDGDTSDFIITSSPSGYLAAQEAIDATMGYAVAKVRELTDPPISPLRAEFMRSKPKNIKAFENFFQCDLFFNCERSVLVYPKDVGENPLNRVNEKLARTMDVYLSSLLEEIEDKSFTRIVYANLGELLVSGEATLSQLSKKLNSSERSIQRKLKAEETSFKDVLNDLRFDLAKRYLKEGKYNIGEIGYYLGFSSHSNFVRFFKGRINCAPSEYTQNMNSEN